MSKFAAFFKASPFLAAGCVMAAIVLIALLSRVSGLYSLFG